MALQLRRRCFAFMKAPELFDRLASVTAGNQNLANLLHDADAKAASAEQNAQEADDEAVRARNFAESLVPQDVADDIQAMVYSSQPAFMVRAISTEVVRDQPYPTTKVGDKYETRMMDVVQFRVDAAVDPKCGLPAAAIAERVIDHVKEQLPIVKLSITREFARKMGQ